MILRTELVDQIVDGEHSVTLVKDVVMTSGVPLGMVRKRLPPPAETRTAVLLIHGFGQNRYTWHIEGRSFSAYLAERGFDVFNLDLRGHGRSGQYSDARPHAVEQYVREDLPSFAREAIRLSGHEQVFLVGHSMGGLISYAAASTVLRDYVQGIVTIGSPYRFGDGSGFLSAFSALAHGLRFTGVFDSNPRLPLGIVGEQFRALRRFWDQEGLPLPVRGWHPGTVEPHLLDRYKPGIIAVLRSGKRFTNESESYHDVGAALVRACDGQTETAAWLICDHPTIRKYGLGFAKPAPVPLGKYLSSGYIQKGSTLAELAAATGIDAAALEATVTAYNRGAEHGEDPEFGRGRTSFNRYLADPEHKPNPCVGPIRRGPFYALKIVMGDLGTFDGLRTTVQGQVQRADGSPIEGLFAVGNDRASIMGGNYPGAGITLGPAMTFGYITGRHLAGISA